MNIADTHLHQIPWPKVGIVSCHMERKECVGNSKRYSVYKWNKVMERCNVWSTPNTFAMLWIASLQCTRKHFRSESQKWGTCFKYVLECLYIPWSGKEGFLVPWHPIVLHTLLSLGMGRKRRVDSHWILPCAFICSWQSLEPESHAGNLPSLRRGRARILSTSGLLVLAGGPVLAWGGRMEQED